MMEILIGYLVIFVAQAILLYGMTFGYFETKYPNMGNISIAFKIAILGGLLPFVAPAIVFFLSEKVKYGLRYK